MLPAHVPTLCLLMGTSVGNSHTSSSGGRLNKKSRFPLGCFMGVFSDKKNKIENQIHFSLKESIGETDTTEIHIAVRCLPAP